MNAPVSIPAHQAPASFSQQQGEALAAISTWFKAAKRGRGQQVFRLFGYAGTGKTTLARHIADEIGGNVLFGAFTGKAALVLRSKGCDASTIHSMIYIPKEDTSGVTEFVLNHDSPLNDADLCIIDEVSMVDEELGRDLLSFGKPVLVLGDPAQLPPVKGQGFFTNARPDFMLTDIHRQARDNPIIRIAMSIREGNRLQECDLGAVRVIPRVAVNAEMVLGHDQVLVGLNKSRRSYNGRLRALKGFVSGDPDVGDRLVCLRNNRTKGLLNGSLWRVDSVKSRKKGRHKMIVAPEDAGGVQQAVQVSVLYEFFQGREADLDWRTRRESDEFDFGYALTVHKAQGSQWGSVMLFDESGSFREDRARWLYTGCTRAAERLTIAI